MHIAKLKCRVGEGVLHEERAILFQSVDGLRETWDSNRRVELPDGIKGLAEDRASGLVPVGVVERDDAQERVLVRLNNEVVLGGRQVWVPASELVL